MGAPAKLVPRAGVVLATRRVLCASVNNPIGQQVHGLGPAGAPLPPRVPEDKNPRLSPPRTWNHCTHGPPAPGTISPKAAGRLELTTERCWALGLWGGAKGRTQSPALASKGGPSLGTFADAGPSRRNAVCASPPPKGPASDTPGRAPAARAAAASPGAP